MRRSVVLLALVLVTVPAHAGFLEKCRRAFNPFAWFRKDEVSPPPAPAAPPRRSRPADPKDSETRPEERLTAPTAPDVKKLTPLAPVALWQLKPVKAVKLGKPLGTGGFGQIHEAELSFGDGSPSETVVVKQLSDETPANKHLGNLLLEAEWLSRAYPGDAAAIEVDGVAYLVQKRAGVINVEQASKTARENRIVIAEKTIPALLDEVERLHGLGIVHRDINPANLMLGRDGTARVVDFALAKRQGDKVASDKMGGRAPYMGPDAWISRTVDEANDTFGLGMSILQLECPEAFAKPYTVQRRLPGSFWDAVGRVPDNRKDISPERAMAHMTAVKRTIQDYRKLLDASSKGREAFAKEWVEQWKRSLALAEDRKNPELVHAMMYEFFSAPILGPELWAALKDPKLQAAVLKDGVAYRNKLNSGNRPFGAWSYHWEMMPMFDEFFANPLVKDHPELKKLEPRATSANPSSSGTR